MSFGGVGAAGVSLVMGRAFKNAVASAKGGGGLSKKQKRRRKRAAAAGTRRAPQSPRSSRTGY